MIDEDKPEPLERQPCFGLRGQGTRRGTRRIVGNRPRFRRTGTQRLRRLNCRDSGFTVHRGIHADRRESRFRFASRQRASGVHMPTLLLQTHHLDLHLRSTEDVLAAVSSLPPEHQAEISPEWLDRVRASPEPTPWTHGFAIVERMSEDMIGSCAFKGPPDAAGVVEIAYEIAPAHQRRGYAREAARATSHFALEQGGARCVSRPHAAGGRFVREGIAGLRIHLDRPGRVAGRRARVSVGTAWPANLAVAILHVGRGASKKARTTNCRHS